MKKVFHYGGQALFEGVMMRGQRHLALALRTSQGELRVVTQPLPTIYTGRLRSFPLVRGFIALVETLVLGIQTLLYSAEVYAGEEAKISPGLLWGTLALALVFGVALFFVAPLLLARLLDPYIGSSLVSNLIEGFLRLGIFVAYLKGVGLFPDIKRVFAYHGAEHKVVNAFEAGAPLEVESVRNYHTAHVRCGTSFLLAVLVLSILVFSLLGRPGLWQSILSRLVLLPVVAALGYEFIRWSAEHTGGPFRSLMGPGLALQAMTTREPDEGQLEVAISALKGVIQADNPPKVAAEPGLLEMPTPAGDVGDGKA